MWQPTMTSTNNAVNTDYHRENGHCGKEEIELKNPGKKQLSLAERIKEFREKNLVDNETNHGMAGDSVPQDLYSLIRLYRDILGVESKLTADVLRSVSSIRTSGLRTRSPDSRLKTPKQAYAVPPQGPQKPGSPEITNRSKVTEASEMTQVLLTPREPEIFKTHEESTLLSLPGISRGTKRASVRGNVFRDIVSSSQDQHSNRLSPRGVRRSRFSRRKLIVAATKSRGASSGLHLAHIVDSSEGGYQAVLDAFRSKSDTVSCEQTSAAQSPAAIAERSHTQLENDRKISNTDLSNASEKRQQHIGFNIVKNLMSTKQKLARKKSRKYGGYSKRSTKRTPTNRRFHFVGQSLTRSFSVPSLNDGLFHGCVAIVKGNKYCDIEQMDNPDKPFTKEDTVDKIRSQKSAGRSKKQQNTSGLRLKEPGKLLPNNRVRLPGSTSPCLTGEGCKGGIILPSIHGNKNGPSSASTHVARSQFRRRPYLRSRSCGALNDEKHQERLVPRFLALYKDLKALDTLSTENNTNIRMQVRAANQNSDIKVTWGTKPEEAELQLFTKPSYMFDVASVYKAVYGRKKKAEKRKKEGRVFLYPREMSVVGLRNDNQNVSSFMGPIPKPLDVHQAHDKRSVYHRNCVAVGSQLPWRYT